MMLLKPVPRLMSTLVLCLALAVGLLPAALVVAQQPQQPAATAVQTAPDYSTALAAIEKTIDERRKQFGIPGVGLVIVKDDKIIYLKGLGVKDFEKNVPVTPDTRFAIGSASKAFTAMLAVMSADERKLSLDDSPKKFLPYFTLKDPDAAAKITIRDLLAHRSGLNRTDLAMASGALNREEVIKVAGLAKPTAKLGEKFQYQNVMYAAAGEVVAKAHNSTWDKLIETRIFKPLGMKNSDTTPEAMQKSSDYSFGYEYNPSTKETRRLPQRSIAAAAPAGAINSTARDMAQWIRLMLGNGVLGGRRLVSEKNFDELVRKQINIAGPVDYGLGWFLRQWNGNKVLEHGGNIDGFNSQVALMPDQKLGFALLTNVTASPLGAIAMSTIWNQLVGQPKAAEVVKSSEPAADPKQEVGKYLLAAAGVSFEVSMKDDKLVLTVPGQPAYPMENIGGRRYKLASPAPAGFFATFRPVKDKESESELFLEQPQGNLVLAKVRTETAPAAAAETNALISVDDLIAKMIEAYGGEENMRKHKSSLTTVEVDLENQGVQAKGTISARAPNMSGSEVTFTALGKKIGSLVTYFDGTNGGEQVSFAPEETYSGKRLEDIRAGSDFYDILNWKTNYKTISVKRLDKVDGEDVYVVERRNEKGTPITDYISTKSFLLLRRDSIVVSETSAIEFPVKQTFADYRKVDGVILPFKSVSNNIANGDIVIRVLDVKFDVEIADSVFRKPSAASQR